jgi:hypothetical protein
MIRVLSMIAVAGFLLSVVCLGAAFSLAGPEAVTRGAWSWDGHHWGWPGVNVEVGGSGPRTTREIAWKGGESLDIDIPADVRFTQAAGPAKVVVSGPADALAHVVIDNGHIGFDRPEVDTQRLTVEIRAPKLTRFGLNGDGHLEIDDYNQDRLQVELTGDADVVAHGQAKTAVVTISGSGDADLSGLAADGTQVTISGSGEAKVAPKAWAKLDISGSGNVTLLSRPARLETHVSGSGQVDQEDNEAEPAAPAPPAART